MSHTVTAKVRSKTCIIPNEDLYEHVMLHGVNVRGYQKLREWEISGLYILL